MHEFARKTRDKILRRVEFICNLIFIDDWGKSCKTEWKFRVKSRGPYMP